MNNLRYLRKTRTNLTMKQLGQIVGVSESAIGYYETGKREPDYEMLLKLSEAIGCTVADIMETPKEKQPAYDDELAKEIQILRDSPETRAMLHVYAGLDADKARIMRKFIESLGEDNEFTD